MSKEDHLTRREFLERSASGAVFTGLAGVATGQNAKTASKHGRGKRRATAAWTPAPRLGSPNILVIMVDQLRLPAWLGGANPLLTPGQGLLPNIVGRIQANSYSFNEYFVAATACSPSRSALLTGLYSPQTCMYVTETSTASPVLNPAFPTWAMGVPLLNPAYAGNIWWFGKWHLSYPGPGPSALSAYGFNTRTYPGGPSGNPSPNGYANEGTNGGTVTSGTYEGVTFASDQQITNDFLGWFNGLSATAGPWCATVSLINPHDIAFAPAWMQTGSFPPTNVLPEPIYFSPPAGPTPQFYSAVPSPWNNENLSQVTGKPRLQLAYQSAMNSEYGSVTDWIGFLNNYYWLQNLVDQQVGTVLNNLYASPFAKDTIVIFLSDHGEYGGSHGLHDKGGAVYDEAIRVPLYVQFPGQTGTINQNQMCSAVDFFGLICDFATGGNGQWRLAYPDLANRQSIWSFLSSNSSETRVTAGPIGLPYVLHTMDESSASENGELVGVAQSHIVCLRTKDDPTSGIVGGKLAYYYKWGECTTYSDGSAPDAEFYDYNPSTSNNVAETGNDFTSNNSITQTAIEQYTTALGGFGTSSSGIAGNELDAPLVGKGNDGQPLSHAQTVARASYLQFVSGTSCS